MAKDPYVFAPEADEDDHGMVKIADDYAVWHTFSPAQARQFAHHMLSAAAAADGDMTGDAAQRGEVAEAYAVVESLGGVVQNTESGPSVMLVTIDWDEINDTSDKEALEYATTIVGSIEGLPPAVAERWKADVSNALAERGLTLPD